MVDGAKHPGKRDAAAANAEAPPQDLFAQNAKLRSSLMDLQRQHRELLDRFAEVEEHNRALECLFVTAYQLHATLDPAEVLTMLDEILVNLVGAERFELWATSSGGEPTDLLLESQAARGRAGLSSEEREMARAVVERGPWFFADDDEPPDGVDALVIVPLRAASASVGVLLIRKFLDHKASLNQTDARVLNLIADQAGVALLSAKLHAATRGRRP